MNSTYRAELEAAQATLDRITGFVKVELQKLGFDAVIDVAKGMDVPDAMFIRIDAERLNIRAHVITYGAAKGRIEWHAYAHRREHHGSDVPQCGLTTSAPDADAKRIAKAIASKLIEPNRDAIARYNARADEWDAHRAALPAHIETVRKMGFRVDEPRAGATEAPFYLPQGQARINSNGSVYFERLSLDAETARCVLEFLANRPKG